MKSRLIFYIGIAVLLLASWTAFAGCKSWMQKNRESSLDAELAKSGLPSPPGPAAPEESQPGFAQEPKGTTNS